MDLQKYNSTIHSSSKVSELILNSTSYHNFNGFSLQAYKNNLSSKIDDNKALFENIYILIEDNSYLGVIIFSYNNESNSLNELIKLLISFRINDFFEKLYFNFLKSSIEIGKDDVYLDLIYIEPEFRSKGKGTFIINKLIELIKNNDSKQIKLHVDHKNIGARNFYEKLGFKYSKGLDETYLNDYLEMTYTIN